MEIKVYSISEFYNDGDWDGIEHICYGLFATKELAIKHLPKVVKYSLMKRGYYEELAERVSKDACEEKFNVGFGSPYEEEITSHDYNFKVVESFVKIIEDFDEDLDIKRIVR